MIKDHELEMAYDNNATHVLQTMLSIIKDTLRCELNKVIIGDLKNLSLDSNGICLIKKFIITTTIEEKKTDRNITKSIWQLCDSIFIRSLGHLTM